MYNQNNYPKHSSDKIIQPESVLKNRQDLVMPLVHPKWPEFDPDNAKTKTYQFIIDSRDRNRSQYPDPNKYILNLLDDFDNVTSIELIHAYVPSSDYTINNSNNKLYISSNNTITEITLDEGIYQIIDNTETETYLFNELDNQLSDNNFDYIKSIYSKNLNKTIFYTDFNKVSTSPDNKFIFNGGLFNYDNNLGLTDSKYKIQSIGYNIGFEPSDVEFKTSDTITYNGTSIIGSTKTIKQLLPKKIINLIKDANNEIHIKLTTETKTTIAKFNFNNLSNTNLLTISFVHGNALVTNLKYTIHLPYIISPGTIHLIEDPYILLFIRDLNIYNARDKNSSKAFCKIPLEREVDFDNLSLTGIIKKFSTPKKIDKFDIKFYRYNRITGNTEDILYDFKGKDHVLTFAITCTNNPYIG